MDANKPVGLQKTVTNQVSNPAIDQFAAGAPVNPLAPPKSTTQGKPNEMGQQQFLTLLVNQLQHQDPLDPMKSEEFASQLAQFSSLEQLLQINQKLGTGSGTGAGSVSTMAAFLGHQVVFKDGPQKITNGKGPGVLVDVPAGAQSLRVDMVDENGQIVGSQVVNDLQAGSQIVKLDHVNVPDGSYDYRVSVVNANGQFASVRGRPAGNVEGFVVEPTPALIVDGVQVSMEDVVEVRKG